MELLSFKDHFLELKSRIIKIVAIYIIFFMVCYYYKENIYYLLLSPLTKTSGIQARKIIYTGLAEAFFTYIKLAAFSSFIIILPFISIQLYLFISKGLHKSEKIIAASILSVMPFLFVTGSFFVFYYVMPKTWLFFLSFENNHTNFPLVLEARISEYLNLIIQLILAFGIAFQVPVALVLLNLLKLIKVDDLVKKRRIAIIINFILGGILTPPDVISQFALAIPLLLLYEISIMICKIIESRKIDVRYKMD